MRLNLCCIGLWLSATLGGCVGPVGSLEDTARVVNAADIPSRLTVMRDDALLSAEAAEQLIRDLADDGHDGSALVDLALVEQALTERPLYAQNDVKLLIDGPQTYASMLAAIAEAENSIHMESFIFADDAVGQRFAEALIEASQRGVAVRLIFDGLANIGTDEALFETLRDRGVAVRKYNPPDPT